MGIIQKVYNVFGTKIPHYIYEVQLSDIVVPEDFVNHPPRASKYIQHLKTYKKDKRLQPVILNHKWVIKDGYITYLIYKGENKKTVPCVFVD